MDVQTTGAAKPPANGIYFKVGAIGLLILILQIPIACIQSLISERIQTKAEAEQFVTQLSGRHQTIVAPLIAVPYISRYLDEKQREKSYRAYAQVLPDSLHISSTVEVERRYRGIFEFPVYTATVQIDGSFQPLKVTPPDVAEQDILWNEASVDLGITDPRTIREAGTLQWDEATVEPEPGVHGSIFGGTGIHFPLGASPSNGSVHKFHLKLIIGGSNSLNFLPVGRTTEVNITSPWPHPSFTGNYLPVDRSINDRGFTATWKVLDLGRSFPRIFYGNGEGESGKQALTGSQFGVGLYSPVDTHRMSDRALKYELFVITLTFLVFALFEIFCSVRIHSMQYLLVGAALVLFYLLLLSLSEHLGFSLAYVFASALVLALVAGYSRSVLGARSGAATVGLSLGLLYGFFYTLLQEQDYSLLIGSLGLTAILAFVMYLTRNLDWYRLAPAPVPEPQPLP